MAAKDFEVNDLVRAFEETNINDEDFYGLQGLQERTLYRVCRLDENLSEDIVAKAKTKDEKSRRVEQHVGHGSKSEYKTRFISTTTCLYTARLWAFYRMEEVVKKKTNNEKEMVKNVCKRKHPLPIITIDLSNAPPEHTWSLINLTNENVRKHFLKRTPSQSWAMSSKEVLFQERIPKIRFNEWTWPAPDGCSFCDNRCKFKKSQCPCYQSGKLCGFNCGCSNGRNNKCQNIEIQH